MTVGQQLEETLGNAMKCWAAVNGAARSAMMLDAVKISHVEQRLQQYPHRAFRRYAPAVMIAMAMLCQPRVLIADEPTTALDVTIPGADPRVDA